MGSFKEHAALRVLRGSTEHCPVHRAVRICDRRHMQSVGKCADICRDYIVLPRLRFDFYAVYCQSSFLAKIPSRQLQPPVLHLCFADQRCLAGKVRLSVQVDPSAGAAEPGESFVIVNCCKKFCRSSARRFHEFFLRKRSIRGLILRDNAQASGHRRRSHRCAGHEHIGARISICIANCRVVKIECGILCDLI